MNPNAKSKNTQNCLCCDHVLGCSTCRFWDWVDLNPKVKRVLFWGAVSAYVTVAVFAFTGCATVDKAARWYFDTPPEYRYNHEEKVWVLEDAR
jgi:hypothetical protein